MNSKKNWLVHDHSQHEENLSRCKEAVKSDEWDKASSIFKELVKDLKSHITQEEEEVFPIYEALVKISHDPIRTLCTEHDRIISLLKDVQQSIKTRDSEHGLECLYRLEDEVIKHEEKEEDIFLPMAGYVLDARFWETRRQSATSSAVASVRNWDF